MLTVGWFAEKAKLPEDSGKGTGGSRIFFSVSEVRTIETLLVSGQSDVTGELVGTVQYTRLTVVSVGDPPTVRSSRTARRVDRDPLVSLLVRSRREPRIKP